MMSAMANTGMVVPHPMVSSIPTVVALAAAIRAAGQQVHLFSFQQNDADDAAPWSVQTLLSRRAAVGGWARIRDLQDWRRTLRHYHETKPFTTIVCADAFALVAVAPLARAWGVPCIYLSLELLFWSELRSLSQLCLKALETLQVRQCAFVLIQDRIRAAALARSTCLRKMRWIELPNAWPSFEAAHDAAQLRKTLGLGRDARIVIHAGSTSEWTMLEDIVAATATWPREFVLVVQARSCDADAFLRSADPQRVRVLEAGCAPEQLARLMGGADLAVAFYRSRPGDPTLGRNLALVGKSSGKLSTYLQAGLPVIVNRGGGLESLVSKWECGEVVRGPAEIGSVLERLWRHRAEYGARSRACFQNEFSTARFMPPVLRAIEAAGAPHRTIR